MASPTTGIDEVKLTRYLEDEISGFEGPIEIQQFASGRSNPTYSIKAQSGIYVLRRQPFGPLLKSAHAVDREYRVIEALKATDVPVPLASSS
jgi:aminoglycoside phosphotransferase (APT) family kinase protein